MVAQAEAHFHQETQRETRFGERGLAALGLRVMPRADVRRAPGMLAALTSVVHECKRTDDHEHQRA
jgi:hypothetical protein